MTTLRWEVIKFLEDLMAASNTNSGLEALPYTVVRIRAGDLFSTNDWHSGTGFFYNLRCDSGEIPLIVSNRHVLCEKTWIEIDFASADDQGTRIFGPPIKFRIEPGQLPIFAHPDPLVDLAAIPLNPLLASLTEQRKKPHILYLNKDLFIPDNHQSILHDATSGPAWPSATHANPPHQRDPSWANLCAPSQYLFADWCLGAVVLV
jgi:hypothetical protein